VPPPTAPRRDRRVVALSWPNFLDHMRDNWTPGQHMALIGPTGEGKTTLAIGLLNLRRYVLALDAKGYDDSLAASGYERLLAWPPASRHRDNIANGHPARFIVGGHARTDGEVAELGRLLEATVKGVREEGRWTLYLDEFQLLADRRMMGVTHQIEELLISARTRGTSVMCAFQAPSWVPRAATRQATWCICWQTHDEDNLKTIAQSMGRNWRELQAMMQELPEFHVLAIPRRHREPLVFTHPPKVL
jgi:hypothetical protein